MAPLRTPISSSPRVMVPTPVHQTILKVQNAPPSVSPVASRTRVAQAAAMKFSQGPVGSTRSQSYNVLKRALYAASFLDSKGINAKRLASQKNPPAIFAAALAVIDIDSDNML